MLGESSKGPAIPFLACFRLLVDTGVLVTIVLGWKFVSEVRRRRNEERVSTAVPMTAEDPRNWNSALEARLCRLEDQVVQLAHGKCPSGHEFKSPVLQGHDELALGDPGIDSHNVGILCFTDGETASSLPGSGANAHDKKTTPTLSWESYALLEPGPTRLREENLQLWKLVRQLSQENEDLCERIAEIAFSEDHIQDDIAKTGFMHLETPVHALNEAPSPHWVKDATLLSSPHTPLVRQPTLLQSLAISESSPTLESPAMGIRTPLVRGRNCASYLEE